MKIIIIEGDGWGVDSLMGGEGLAGANLNIKNGPHELFQIPWSNKILMALIKELAEKGLTTEERRELAPTFTNGILLPGQDFQQGPQG